MTETSRFLSALTEAVVPADDYEIPPQELRAVLAETAAFVEGQVNALPRRLRWMFALGIGVFRLYVRMTCFHAFCALPPARRRTAVELWAYGPVPLFRALFKLVRSTALLAFFEAPQVIAAVERKARSGNPASVESAR